MNFELKQAIVNWMFDNRHEFQLLNAATEHFRQYIFTDKGDYCIGGEKVNMFIIMTYKLLYY